MGQLYYERTLPDLVRRIERLAEAAERIILLRRAEPADLFDALQTMVEGAMQVGGQIDLRWV